MGITTGAHHGKADNVYRTLDGGVQTFMELITPIGRVESLAHGARVSELYGIGTE